MTGGGGSQTDTPTPKSPACPGLGTSKRPIDTPTMTLTNTAARLMLALLGPTPGVGPARAVV
jgi:hypothetical protein